MKATQVSVTGIRTKTYLNLHSDKHSKHDGDGFEQATVLVVVVGRSQEACDGRQK